MSIYVYTIDLFDMGPYYLMVTAMACDICRQQRSAAVFFTISRHRGHIFKDTRYRTHRRGETCGKLNLRVGMSRSMRTARCRFGDMAQSTVVPWLLWVL